MIYNNLVAVLVLSLLLGNHDERRKDAIKAFTVNEGFEEACTPRRQLRPSRGSSSPAYSPPSMTGDFQQRESLGNRSPAKWIYSLTAIL